MKIDNCQFQVFLAMVMGVMALGGCRTARVAQPLTGELAGNEPREQLAFWHTLAERPVVSNDEAFHGLLLYLDGKDEAGDYEGRVKALSERRMLPGRFARVGDEAVTRGTLAVAICRVLEIKGGLMKRLTDGNQRYAVKELVFLDLYPPSGVGQTFTGIEFLGIVGRMEDWQRAKGKVEAGGRATTRRVGS